MSEADGSIWVELVGNVIVARARGTLTAQLLRDCQARVVTLARTTGCRRIMYDALEIQRPTDSVTLTQLNLTQELRKLSARIAIVVPNSAIAFAGRIAFHDGDHRVFYNGIVDAFRWLNDEPSASS